jgi:hypothetical protein
MFEVILGQTKSTKNEYGLSFETEGVTHTQNMRLHLSPAARRIAIGLLAETQTRSKFAPQMRMGGRCAVAPRDRSLLARAFLAVT